METIKEEKKADLEQLLNSLIEKGWKPFGMEQYDRFIIESAGDMCFRWKYPGADGESAFDYNYDYFKIRELASIDSGLWQFVCENGMVEIDREICGVYSYRFTDVQVCLIRSSLKDESELEDFLLSNIVIKDE